MDNTNNNNNNNSWYEFNLNPFLTSTLSKTFKNPTEIQKKVLIYTTSKTDLIIQARTGEGKTLCYAIPILNYILNFYSRSPEMIKKISPVSLILVPTHELGIQVKNHIEKIIIEHKNKKKKNIFKFNIKIACVLGGFAKPKQLKILNKKFPEIIIATPGRLWEIIENEESDLLNNLKYLKFFVIDEADRMTQTGHFKELKNIINHVYNKIEIKINDFNNQNEIKEKIINKIGNNQISKEEDEEENKKLAQSLGVNENDIETIDPLDLIRGNDVQFDDMNLDEENENEENEIEENENEENEKEENENEENNKNNDKNNKQKNTLNIKKYKKEKTKELEDNIQFENIIKMRTFLCSATIDSVHKDPKKNNNNNNNNLSSQQIQFQNLIKNLKFYNKLLYIKLKSSENLLSPNNIDNESSILPSKLSIECYKCDSSLKDYYLYYILKTQISSSKKRTIIFTNSISHTKKLHSIFTYFSPSEFPSIAILHSKMQQSNRLKNFDKFKSSQKSILFCTDIGARGLDIPNIDLVIHYHIPTKTETFVHRSGRTARANKNGNVVSLISEKEIDLYRKIMKDLNLKEFVLKSISLDKIEKIKSLFEFAKEVELHDFKKRKENNEKKWFDLNAKKLDVDFDYDLFYNNNNNDEENKKFLNKKRKLINKEKFKKKRIYLKLRENNIKSSSFLTPDQVKKLNDLMKDDEFKNQNLTQSLNEAKNDQKFIKKKYKPKQKRYMHRRKGK